jgi:MFS family permease
LLLNLTFALALLNMANTRAARIVFALYALSLGAEPVTVGALAAMFSAPAMALSWPVGRWADRYGARWLLTIGAAFGIAGMLLPFWFPHLVALFIAAGLVGLSFTFYTVTLQNLVGVASAPAQRSNNFSTFSLMLALAGFIGPVLGGFSIDHAGYALGCLLLSGLCILPLILLFTLGRHFPPGENKPAPAGGLRGALGVPGLWRILAIGSLVVTGIDVFQFYLPIYGHDIGLSASVIGLVLSMFSVAAFVVRAVMPRLLERYSEERILVSAFWVGAASFLLVPLTSNPWLLGLLSFTFGMGMGCSQPITMMMTFSNSAEGRSGEALGLRLTVNHMTRVVCPLLFGAIGSLFGPFGLFAVFWANAVMLGAGPSLSRFEGSGLNRPSDKAGAAKQGGKPEDGGAPPTDKP